MEICYSFNPMVKETNQDNMEDAWNTGDWFQWAEPSKDEWKAVVWSDTECVY
jgi:hypothetical protein